MDLIALVVAAVQAVLALALLFLIPGITLGPALLPGASTPVARVGRAAGVSLLTSTLACTVLAWAGLLRPTIVVAVLIGLTILPLHAGLPRLPGLPNGRARRWWLGAGAATAFGAAIVVIPSRLQVGADLLPFTSTVWYYANLARAVATSNGFPSVLPEWGAERPFQTDYLPVTAHTAAALQLLPGDLTLQIELYRIAILIVAFVVTTLLFRRWVSTWLATLAAVFLLTTVRLEFKFLAYKPETFALVLGLFALYVLDRAVVERSRRAMVLAVATGAVVFLSHAEVFLVLVAAGVGVAAARWLVAQRRFSAALGGTEKRRGDRFGLRVDVGRRGLGTLAIGGAVLAAAAGLGVAGNAALTGQSRILDYAARSRVADDRTTFTTVDQIPAGWTFTRDPTWDFYVAAVAPGQLGSAPPRSFFDRRLLPRTILDVWPGLDARTASFLVVLVALLAVPLVTWPLLDARRRRFVLTWVVFGVALFVGSYVLFLRSDTYVPARVGPRRLMPYELFLPVVAAVVGLFIVDRLWRAGLRALLPRRGAMVAAGLALAILSAGVVSAAPTTEAPDDADPGLTTVGFQAYRWIDGNLPPDARILTNAYTDGALTALSRRAGIIDGRAVYLENPDFLAESTALVLGARVVFANPDTAPAQAYLVTENVDYLLVAGPNATGSDLGGYLPFDTDLATLQSSGRYTLVQTFGGRLYLFQVVRPA